MGKRAEMRRKAKEEKRKNATYVLTREQLDEMVANEVEEQLREEYVAEMYSSAVRDAFMMCMVFPMEVLRRDYWQKSYKEKCPKFVEKVLMLYNDWNEGKVDITELYDTLWDVGRIRFERRDD